MAVTYRNTELKMVAATAEEAIAFAYCRNNINSSSYYVQSPSCSSVISPAHADHRSGDHQLLLLLPSYHHSHHTEGLRQQPDSADENQEEEEEEEEEEENLINQQHYPSKPTITLASAGFQLSRCSSSRASIDSLALLQHQHQHQQQEKIDVRVLPHNHHHHSMTTMMTIPKKLAKNVGAGDGDDDHDDDEDENNYHDNCEYNMGWRKYFSFRTYPASSFWIFVQLIWRLFLSFTAALLVFYIATKPPPPHVSIQVTRMKHFELAEGVDSSGVSTNFLNCNITVGLVIDNKSQVFGLAIRSPIPVDIYFGRFPLVLSQEAEIMHNEEREQETVMTIRAHEKKGVKVNAGTRGKPMYAAGRDMVDMLRSGRGLSLSVSLSLSSYYDYRLIGWLIRPTFHYHARCLLFLINFDHVRHPNTANYMYNSTCSLLAS